jgi:hypothetical protein
MKHHVSKPEEQVAKAKYSAVELMGHRRGRE